MIIFLFGLDSFRLYSKFKEIVENYQNLRKSKADLVIFEKENLDFQKFKDFLNSPSLFEEKKLIVLKNAFSDKKFKENFFKEKEKILTSKNIILICEEGEIDKKDPLFSFLLKNSKWQEFQKLKGEKLKNWAKKEILKYNLNIDPKALKKLLEFVGEDTWRLAQEIKKLANFKKEGKIEIKDIEELVEPDIEIQIFKTIDALVEKKKDLVLNFINFHFRKGDHPLYLFGALIAHFRLLLSIKDLVERQKSWSLAFKELNISPFLRKKIWVQAQKFDTQKLKKIYQKLLKIDLGIKTGQLDPQTGLELLVAEI
jgi:DNA polymerase-3 subunit delta